MVMTRMMLCAVLLISLVHMLCGQQSGVGSIFIGNEEGLPLEAVQVFSDDYEYTAISDSKGLVPFPSSENISHLNFTYIGYATQRLSLADLKHFECDFLDSRSHRRFAFPYSFAA